MVGFGRVRNAITSAGLAVAGLLLLAGTSFAAQFSADMVQSMGTMKMNGKVYVNNKMIRNDMKMGAQNTTIIVRGDKGVTWMLYPAKKEYMEMPGAKMDMSGPGMEAQLKKMATQKKLGQTTVNGQLCDKYLYTFKNKEMGTATMCMSRKLQWPMRMESKSKRGSMTMELRNVKMGAPAASVFQIPKGYKKTSMPKMHGMPPPKPKKK